MVFLATFTSFHDLLLSQSKSTSKHSVSLMICLAAFTVFNVLVFFTLALPVATKGTFVATMVARESSPGRVREMHQEKQGVDANSRPFASLFIA
jgi:hypothetical protein